jgi:ABC-type multidrug transport system fused ATPase/permease subunit
VRHATVFGTCVVLSVDDVLFLGLVSQEPNLLNETIAKNISFGNKRATNEMIVEAAKQANAHDFILSFPAGYNTQVGNGGSQLSGGQKQR